MQRGLLQVANRCPVQIRKPDSSAHHTADGLLPQGPPSSDCDSFRSEVLFPYAVSAAFAAAQARKRAAAPDVKFETPYALLSARWTRAGTSQREIPTTFGLDSWIRLSYCP